MFPMPVFIKKLTPTCLEEHRVLSISLYVSYYCAVFVYYLVSGGILRLPVTNLLVALYLCTVCWFLRGDYSPSDDFDDFWDTLDPLTRRKYGVKLLKAQILERYSAQSDRLVFDKDWTDRLFTDDEPFASRILSYMTRKQRGDLLKAFLKGDKHTFKLIILRALEVNGDRRHYAVKFLWNRWNLIKTQQKLSNFKRVHADLKAQSPDLSDLVNDVEGAMKHPIVSLMCGIISMQKHLARKDFVGFVAAFQNFSAACDLFGISEVVMRSVKDAVNSASSGSTDMVAQSPDPVEQDSLISKFIGILGLVMSLKVVVALGLDQSAALVSLMEHLKEVSSITTLKDKIIAFLKLIQAKYERCKREGVWATLFGPNFHDWKSSMAQLQKASADKSLLKMDRDDLMDWLNLLIAQGEGYSNHPKFSFVDKISVMNVHRIRNDMISYWASLAVRKVPFCVTFYGSPGSGKSSIVESIAQMLANYEQREATSQDVFPVPLADKHWNNCRYPQIVLLNDVRGQGHTTADPQRLPELITNLVDRIPFATPQASIEDKAANCITPKGVILTTNDSEWNFENLGQNWAKLLRRFHYVFEIDIPKGVGILDRDPKNLFLYKYYTMIPLHEAGKITFVRDKEIKYNEMYDMLMEMVAKHGDRKDAPVFSTECPKTMTALSHNFACSNGLMKHPGFLCSRGCPIRERAHATMGVVDYPIEGYDFPLGSSPVMDFFTTCVSWGLSDEALRDLSFGRFSSMFRSTTHVVPYIQENYKALSCLAYSVAAKGERLEDWELFAELSLFGLTTAKDEELFCTHRVDPALMSYFPSPVLDDVLPPSYTNENGDLDIDMESVFDTQSPYEPQSVVPTLVILEFLRYMSLWILYPAAFVIISMFVVPFMALLLAVSFSIFRHVTAACNWLVAAASNGSPQAVVVVWDLARTKTYDTWHKLFVAFQKYVIYMRVAKIIKYAEMAVATIVAVLLILGSVWFYRRFFAEEPKPATHPLFSQGDRIPLSQASAMFVRLSKHGMKTEFKVDDSKTPFQQRDAGVVKILPAHLAQNYDLVEAAYVNEVQLWAINENGQQHFGKALAIDSNTIIATWHQWQQMREHSDVTYCAVFSHIKDKEIPMAQRIFLDVNLAVGDETTDVAMFYMATTACNNLVSRFVDADHLVRGLHNVTVDENDYLATLVNTTSVTSYKSAFGQPVLFEFQNLTLKYPKSLPGKCSLPCIVSNAGSSYKSQFIFGIHVAGNDKIGTGVSTFVSSSWITKAKSQLAAKNSLVMRPLGVMAPHMYEFDGVPNRCQLFSESSVPIPCSFVGTIGSLRNKPKSSVLRTVFHKDLDDLFEEKLTIPDLGNRGYLTPEGTWTSPVTHYINYFDTMPNLIRYDLLEEAYLDFMFGRPKGNAVPLSVEQAVKGIEGHPLIKKMNLTTSIGSWREIIKDKKEVISLEHINSDLLNEIMTFLEVRDAGFMIANFGEINWKDEPIKILKNILLKFRPFVNMEKWVLVTARMFLLPIIAHMYENKEFFEAYGAFNPASPDFGDLVDRMINLLQMHMGDLKHMDASHKSLIADIVAKVFMTVAADLGYEQRDIDIVEVLVRELMFMMICLNRDVYFFYEKLSSGHLMTFIFNCIALSIIFRFAWFLHLEQMRLAKMSFREHNTLACGGDDSAHATALASFDFFAIKRGMAALGYVYTSARKDGVETAHSGLDEFIFLKRVPVKKIIDGKEYTIGQLVKDSILKNMCFILPSSSVTREDQMLAKVDSAIREASLHDESFFNLIRDLILREYPSFQHKTQEEYLRMYIKHELYAGIFVDSVEREEGTYTSESPDPQFEYSCPAVYHVNLPAKLMGLAFALFIAWTSQKQNFLDKWLWSLVNLGGVKCFESVSTLRTFFLRIPSFGLWFTTSSTIMVLLASRYLVGVFTPRHSIIVSLAMSVVEEELGHFGNKMAFGLLEFQTYYMSTYDPFLQFLVFRTPPFIMHAITACIPNVYFRVAFHYVYNIFFAIDYFNTLDIPAYFATTNGSSPYMSDHLNVLQTREFRITNSELIIDHEDPYSLGSLMRISSNNEDPLQHMSILLLISVLLLTELNITNLSLTSGLTKAYQTQKDRSSRLEPEALMELKAQFQRPVKVAGFVWTNSTTPVNRANILTTYLADPSINHLTSGYCYIRGKMHLTFVVNGFSMWFGKALMAPYYKTNQGARTVSASTWDLPAAMNVPHVSMDPAKSMTYEMAPLWYQPDEWVNVNNVLSDFDLTMFPMFLSSVNGTPPTSVEIVCYMHMTDVELSVAFTAESEAMDLESLKISKVITATEPFVAAAQPLLAAASSVTGVPLPTAKGTAAVAKAFNSLGYGSSVSGYGPVEAVRSQFISNTFSNEYGDISTKLTASPSAAYPIDSSSCGLGDDSEKMLSGITRKWGYVGTYSWPVNVANSTLATINISPMLSYMYPGVAPHSWRLTPMATIASLHDYCSGSVEIAVEICCSEYHRGSIGISYSPDGTPTPLDRRPTALQTVIADISESRIVTMKLPSLAQTPLVPMAGPHSGDVPASIAERSFGDVFIYQITHLKDMNPDPGSPVKINIYIRSGDDLAFYQPTHFQDKFVAQSGDELSNLGKTELTSVASNDTVKLERPVRSLILWGERSTTLMGLVGKPMPSAYLVYATAGTPVPNYMALALPTRPTTLSVSSPNAAPSMMAFLMQCFLACKGSFRLKLFSDQSLTARFVILKGRENGVEEPYKQLVQSSFDYGCGGAGTVMCIGPSGIAPGFMELEIPMRTVHRFIDPQVKYRAKLDLGENVPQAHLYCNNAAAYITAFECGGDDFSLQQFYITPYVSTLY